MAQEEYNPLDYHNLTVNLVRELMDRVPVVLPLPELFAGAGVYALFYAGEFEPYGPVASPDFKRPIYVGKAVPAGARKGLASGARAAGQPLFGRLNEHARSISDARNLELADFRCRYLVVTPLWITMAERFLIENFQPIWNVCIDGFGLHDPGRGRHAGEIPWWDALHPGRQWAGQLRQTRTESDARTRLTAFLEKQRTRPEEAAAEARRAAAEAAAEEETP